MNEVNRLVETLLSWRVKRAAATTYVVSANDVVIAEVIGEDVGELIAQSPRMFSVLSDVLPLLERTSDADPVLVERVRSVLRDAVKV